jgi:D-alanine-D-alanine ligase
MSDDFSQVAVLFGGPSPEHDVSILTGLQALRVLGQNCYGIYWSKTNEFYLGRNANLEASDFLTAKVKGFEEVFFKLGKDPGFYQKSITGVKRIPIETVINCCHGGPGEDGTIQSIFELAQIPLTGPDSSLAQIGMDKWLFYLLIKNSGFACLERRLIMPGFKGEIDLNPPFILKPRFGGSSLGIEIVADVDTVIDLVQRVPYYRQGAVVETYNTELIDLQVAVRNYPEFEISEIERPLKQTEGSYLNYSDKYVAQEGMAGAKRELPAKIPDELKSKILDVTNSLRSIFNIKGIIRVDYLSDARDLLYLNEINTIPGSLARYLFINPKRDFKELLVDMIDEAKKSNNFKYLTMGADGSLLKTVSSIASKLG